jgi:hypothetical protein
MQKIYTLGLAALLVLVISIAVMAQTGVITGTVTDTLGVGVNAAYVTYSQGCGMGQIIDSTYTNAQGQYTFPQVAPNTYKVRASKAGMGMTMQNNVVVVAGETTVVNLVLQGSCGMGGCQHDSLAPIAAEGYAMVDSGMCMVNYWLDTNNDGIAEYRLNFGPPSYNPGSGAQRPEDGDWITITGGLNPMPNPDMIVVYTINGLFWRGPVVRGQNNHWHMGGGVASVPQIGGAYPNPFNPSTTISFSLPLAGEVSVSVWNLNGQRVADLVSGNLQSGNHQVTWNAENMASGIYLVRLEAANTVAIKRVVFTK